MPPPLDPELVSCRPEELSVLVTPETLVGLLWTVGDVVVESGLLTVFVIVFVAGFVVLVTVPVVVFTIVVGDGAVTVVGEGAAGVEDVPVASATVLVTPPTVPVTVPTVLVVVERGSVVRVVVDGTSSPAAVP